MKVKSIAALLFCVLLFCAMFLPHRTFSGMEVGLILLILIVTAVCLHFATKPKKSSGQFEGYVCEICGAEYNKCQHSTLEDYCLVKKV